MTTDPIFMSGTFAPLPLYPSTQARKDFSSSQLAHLHANLSNAIAQVIALPSAKRDSLSTRTFVSSYASDGAQQVLEALIWEDTKPANPDDRLRQRILLLAEKTASSAPGLELRTLLDLCVAFPSRATRLRSILSVSLSGIPDLPEKIVSEVVPAFTSLLSPSRSSGLYGLRKTVRCLTSLLRPSPPALVRPFAHSKDFIVALARAYDDGLTAISRSYGGIRIRTSDTNRTLDHWERIWLDTKVDIVDAFHLIVTTMVQDISAASETELTLEADRIFGIVFALLDITPQNAATESADAVPFLNRPLVADYQYAYKLSRTLPSALRHASRDDARLELLESTLRLLDNALPGGNARDPGVLKLILHSSGIALGASNKATLNVQSASAGKGKAKANAPPSTPPHDAGLDLQVRQVLDIFPDYSSEYIRNLLTHPSFPFRGSAERVIEALLEGTAPDEDALEKSFAEDFSVVTPPMDAPIERRNVFDQEVMDLSCVHIGKKTKDAMSLARDKAEIERMKAEILRLAEAMSEDSDEDSEGEAKALDVIDLNDDFDGAGTSTVKILGDGEDSDDEEGNEKRGNPIKPETILELAYIRDPKLFDRDAQTRRSKPRADLKQQTGWSDEQIEGWKIMLERNPKKDRILQKHEFSGNMAVSISIAGETKGQPSGGQRGGGRGRGRGRGRGQERGGGGGKGGPGEKNDQVARERAFKEKHKSDNRKRGHDKKIAKAGPSG